MSAKKRDGYNASPDLIGFAPIARTDARLLILGSFPGVKSLDAHEYYAHPQNAFWRILGDVVGAHRALPYSQRCDTLQQAGIAVWDVLGACRRVGSLDGDIESESETVNDFVQFLRVHGQIRHVLLNGGKAAEAWRRHAAPRLSGVPIEAVRLPSTSPANAGMPYARKLALWRDAINRTLASNAPMTDASNP